MSFLERAGNNHASLVGASEVSFDRPYTFFSVDTPGTDCNQILYKSAKFPLVARWEGSKLNWIKGERNGKTKKIDGDEFYGGLNVVGLISNDGRIFLHEKLILNGNKDQAEGYCRGLIESYLSLKNSDE